MKLIKCVGGALFLLAASAQAEIVNLDWKEQGDGRAFLDERTGFEWLDLTETNEMSIDQVSAGFGAGGEFEGWRVATGNEVESLLDSYAFQVGGLLGPSETEAKSSETRSTGAYSAASLPIYHMGAAINETNNKRVAGVYKDPLSGSSYAQAMFARSQGGTVKNLTLYWDWNDQYYDSGQFTSATRLGSTGVYLVADGGATLSTQRDPSLTANNANASSDVSAHAGLGLFSLALLGVRLIRRRAVWVK